MRASLALTAILALCLILGSAPSLAASFTSTAPEGVTSTATCLTNPSACLGQVTGTQSGTLPTGTLPTGTLPTGTLPTGATGSTGCLSSIAAAEQCAQKAGVSGSTGTSPSVPTACAGISASSPPSALAGCVQALAAATGVKLPSACSTVTSETGGTSALKACLDAAGLCAKSGSGGRELPALPSGVVGALGAACQEPSLTITAVTPDPASPGAGVTLLGTGFGQTGTLRWVPASGPSVSMKVTRWSADKVLAQIPSAAAGKGTIELSTSTAHASIAERVTPVFVFGPPLPDGKVPVTRHGHVYFVTRAGATTLRAMAGARLRTVEAGMAKARQRWGAPDGHQVAATAVKLPPVIRGGSRSGGKAASPSRPAPMTPSGATSASACSALSPVTEYGPDHLPFSSLGTSVDYNVPSTTVGGVTLASGAAYGTATGDPNTGTVAAVDWAAGIAAARVDGLLHVEYVSHACGSRPDPVTVQAKVIMVQWTDSISAEGASCAPLLAVMVVKPQYSNPHSQQRTLASCLSNLSGSVASFPEDETATEASQALSLVSKAVNKSLDAYSYFDTASTILGVLGSTPQVATFTWTGQLQKGERLSVDVGPSAVIGDSGLGEAVNKVAAVVMVRITDVRHLGLIEPYGRDAYTPVGSPYGDDAHGRGAVSGTVLGLPEWTCPRVKPPAPPPIPGLGYTEGGIELMATPAFHTYLARELKPYAPYWAPSNFQHDFLELELRREPGNPWAEGGWKRGAGGWTAYSYRRHGFDAGSFNYVYGLPSPYTFYVPVMPPGWYEARPILAQRHGSGSATSPIEVNVVATGAAFPVRVFGTCPTVGYGRTGPGEQTYAQSPGVVSATAQGQRAGPFPLPSGEVGSWPLVKATAGQTIHVTLRWPTKKAVGERVVLVGNGPLAWGRVGATGEATLSWVAAPGDTVVYAYGYGTDGGVVPASGDVVFYLKVTAPPVKITTVPTTPAK